jgi:beta-lactamase regulating signal transducer with metallopeptidase domain
MNAPTDLILDTALRGGLLGAGAWLLHRVLRHRLSAAVNHRGLACSLATLALMPVLLVCCDRWAVLPALPQAAPALLPVIATPSSVAPKAAGPLDPQPLRVAQSLGETGPVSPIKPQVKRFQWPSWQSCVVGLWSLMFVAVMLALVREMLQLRRLCRSSAPMADAALLSLAQACAQSIGLRRVPQIRFMRQDIGPLVVEGWHTTVLLPMAFRDWPEERQRAVLLHELAHVKRQDGRVQFLGAMTCALHWFNPFAWLLLKHLRHEAECACDNAVLAADMTAPSYADHLLAVAASGRCASAVAPSMAQPSGLRQRVQAVLSSRVKRGAVGRFAGLIILLGAPSVSLPIMLAQTAEPKPAIKPSTPPSPVMNSLTVKTVDAEGKALAEVMIRAFRTDKRGPITPFKPELTTTTDAKGQWEGELPVGEYMVLAQKGNLVADYNRGQTWWYLNKKELKREFTLNLVSGGEVLVTALNAATRQPVPKAKLVMDCGHTAIADAQGQARFTGVPMGERTLKIMSPPFADTTVDFNNTGQTKAAAEGLMNPGYEVRGQVRTSDGAPLQGARVEDNYSGSTFLVQMNVSVTDAEGRYRLGWYSKSKPLWSFTVDHKDYAEQSKSGLNPPAEGTVATWDFVLDKGQLIAGVVKDKEGKPIKGATVRYGSDWSLIGLRWARSDEQGKFTITKISRKERRACVAEAEGYAPAWLESGPGKGDQVPQLQFTMEKGLTVQGRVVDQAGKPVTGVTISPQMMIQGRQTYVGNRTAVDVEGKFQITSLPTSSTSLDAWGSHVSPVRRLAFDPTKPLVVTVDKPGVIIGKVIDAKTKQPVTKFNVRLDFPKATKPGDEPSPSYSAHLSRRGQDSQAVDGKFVIDELIARAAHAVHVKADGYADAHVDRVVAQPADDPSWPLEFALERGLSVKTQLTDAVTGDPVGGAKLLYQGKGEWPDSEVNVMRLADLRDYGLYDEVTIVTSAADGAAELNLPRDATAFSLVVLAPGYAPVMLVNQSAAKTDLLIPLSPEAKIRGTLAGLPGFDPNQDTLQVATPDHSIDHVTVSPDGTFAAGGLPAGKAVITARSQRQNRVIGSALIDLMPGTTSEVNLPALSRSSVKVIVTLDGKPHDHANVWVSLKEWKKHVICQLGAADVNEVGEAILKNLPPVHAQVQCHDDNLGQMHGQPVDLTDPSRTPVIRFDFKSKAK